MINSSVAVANKFIEFAADEDRGLTQMQLQKLAYIAHGWSLAIYNEPLISEPPLAWDYGPVYADLREALKSYGSRGVSRPILRGDYEPSCFNEHSDEKVDGIFTDTQQHLLAEIFRSYGEFEAFQLSALTHKEGTPWHRVYHKMGRRSGAIPDDIIKEHFLDLKEGRSAA